MVVLSVACSNDVPAPDGYTEVVNLDSESATNFSMYYKPVTADGTENLTITLGSSGICVGALASYNAGAAPTRNFYYCRRNNSC